MNLKKQLFIAFILSFVALLGFGIMALLVSKHTILTFDGNIISFIQGFEAPMLTTIMKFFSFIGGTIPVILISLFSIVFLYKVLKHRSELVLFIAVILGANVLFVTLKQLFHRARPDLHRLAQASNYSFPSGHATMAFALYGVLTFLLWRHISTRLGRTLLIILSGFIIAAIGISRIYLGVHYPSDIIAGYFMSAFWLTFAIGFYQRYKERHYRQKQANE
ncbi:phosphatase PAP2 family protein [Bacillus sp. ISL-18]|uniref:phosphatase PAP2 family protein n=1 Tax=Bacillus sp. ISL-18 TaxID=2819118 RepID=UPI001BE50BD2|nr:phosphatase PAP2 family protein [Bacillus sp. ISL-18]MBT2657941.1 phosphatase PAP2 family protein [Bacillus sp. ISL-18]